MVPKKKAAPAKVTHDLLKQIDIHSSVAVYQQIENHVRFAISAGRLKPSDQLPSVRELSERLKVNPNTVAKAYRDLEVMGLLYTRRGMGVYVQRGIGPNVAKTRLRRSSVVCTRYLRKPRPPVWAAPRPSISSRSVSPAMSNPTAPFLRTFWH